MTLLKYSLLILTSTCFVINSLAQNTVGITMNTSEAFEGYTLFSPIRNKTTYLINNCGEKMHSWTSKYNPGLSSYLLENGILLRTGNKNNTFFDEGGKGGIIEMIDWDGNVIWEYTLSSEKECLHHDIEYLENGNILAIVWELQTVNEAKNKGRSTIGDALWSEKIIEIQPDLINGGATIVWEWRVWDHLVQESNANLDDYGIVAQSAQLIDINYSDVSLSSSDWLHINSIDYNADLDQILLSCHNFGEIWIIDHSTSTAEAASHSGGNAGRGGDLLYRWGNAEAYQQDIASNQKLFGQHDAQWIEKGLQDEGMILVFNNKAGSLTKQNFSSVDLIKTPITSTGEYQYSNTAFKPDNLEWSYTAEVASDFFSNNISGAQKLSNKHILICEGASGRFFEIDEKGRKIWEYINPVNGSSITKQGDAPSGTSVFRATKYPINYQAFADKTLVPNGYIETGTTTECESFTTAHPTDFESAISIKAYPNPAKNSLNIESSSAIQNIKIIDQVGKLIYATDWNQNSIDISFLNNGIYLLQILTINHQVAHSKLVVNR